jgi:hypothetical protein
VLHCTPVLYSVKSRALFVEATTAHDTRLRFISRARYVYLSDLPCRATHRTECASARRTHSALCLPTDVLLGALVVRVELGLALCEMQEAAARRHTRMGTEL